MKILNVRLGLAMNSSSSHSLIFLSDVPDDFDGQSFGWDNFTLSDPNFKRAYFAQQLLHNLRQFVSDEIAALVVREWAGTEADLEGYVDHQSTWALPRDWEGKGLHKQFLDEFKEFVLRPNLVVLGGNDNDDGHPLAEKGSIEFPIVETPNTCLRARKDPQGFWTIFNKENGTKIRFAFDKNFDLNADYKSSTPELVDIKITDYCPYDCHFCYQASTTNGSHADKDRLENVARALSELEVFEVAIGGGEPTMHPYFGEFVKGLRRKGIVPSFTTRNLSWLRDPQLVREYLDECGGFAYSVENGSDITKLESLLECAGSENDSVNVTVQYVLGTGNLASVVQTAFKYKTPLTLLGYKITGRGKNDIKDSMIKERVKYDTENWIKIVKEADKYPTIRIDTALAAQSEAVLKPLVDQRFWHVHEGAHSMYIDAVAGRYASCSYEDNQKADILARLGNKRFHMSDRPTADEIRNAFKSIIPLDARDAAVA